ncbi:molecular chaperone TorD family protein [Winkia sp. UMB6473-AN360BR]|uniref:molecular chaperone TorD family protein n=1 Tax=Winkia TaxID=2692118 RepID=UPI00066118A2|nr:MULTISPECIES: molecular chaperone TorD family protein [Winkia]PMC94386.1 hypothetical protein CJ188_04005 [Actinomyces sp. UMB0918]MDK7185661.1 molecular chaperone TorD family protein [Winkia sp. UMB1295B]MDK7229030.1 molecular chaperone TorD family protein [Winkia sp. UMB1185]MDK8816845.1 molecular chaperone TorD family protein [Winkia sp. UMB6473-AN360BR]NJJ15322.1 molecular chaperone TorD family protein [Winkia neuii]
MAFDPFTAPAADDITSRGVRVGTAAAVLHKLFAAMPDRGLLENISNPALLRMWPLRDEQSVQAAAVLEGEHEHGRDLSNEYARLFGPLGRVSLLGQDSDAALPALYSQFGFTSPTPSLPPTHFATQLAFVGHLSTFLAGLWRQGESPDAHRTAQSLRDFMDRYAGPLALQVVGGVRAESASPTYRAAAELAAALVKEAAALADTAASADPATAGPSETEL